jgi:hypothetical protein
MTERSSSSADATEYVISVATSEDIPEISVLQAANLLSEGGALSIEFPAAWFERVINDMPIVIAKREGRLVGYLVSSSQEATRHLALSQAKYNAYPGGVAAYNSGPLCIAASDRGRGLAHAAIAAGRSRRHCLRSEGQCRFEGGARQQWI